MDVDRAKERAGRAAAERVPDGAVVGLGTGSTAACAIRALGERVADGLDVTGVPTSEGARDVAREAGVPIADRDAPVDVAIDGADAVAEDGRVLLKGGGAAHVREKVVAAGADRFHVVVDARKPVADGDPVAAPVPVAAFPADRAAVERAVRDAGGEPVLRDAERKDGPVITDDGCVVLDCDFGPIADPAALGRHLDAIPGVVGHGLFVDLADRVFVGDGDGVTVTEPA
jgi:ribose 5-phosphate isomerase A